MHAAAAARQGGNETRKQFRGAFQKIAGASRATPASSICADRAGVLSQLLNVGGLPSRMRLWT